MLPENKTFLVFFISTMIFRLSMRAIVVKHLIHSYLLSILLR